MTPFRRLRSVEYVVSDEMATALRITFAGLFAGATVFGAAVGYIAIPQCPRGSAGA